MYKSNAVDIRTTSNDSQDKTMRVPSRSKWNLGRK